MLVAKKVLFVRISYRYFRLPLIGVIGTSTNPEAKAIELKPVIDLSLLTLEINSAINTHITSCLNRTNNTRAFMSSEVLGCGKITFSGAR